MAQNKRSACNILVVKGTLKLNRTIWLCIHGHEGVLIKEEGQIFIDIFVSLILCRVGIYEE